VFIEKLLIVGLVILVIRYWWQVNRGWLRRWWKQTKDRLPRHWHPKSPHDCPHCQAGVKLEVARVNQQVLPWREQRSRRGAKKRITTQGYACLNPACVYFGITDEQVHAVVGNGKRGKDHDIQYLKCQACQKVFTCRKGTPLYYLKTKTERVEMVLWFLVEGVDLSVMVRYTGHGDATLARWLNRMGEHSTGLHNVFFRNLVIALVQFDELYARVRTSEKARWLWLAIDPVSKALPALHLGGRTSADAYAVVHDFKERLNAECVPAATSDGLRSYFYALTAHFGLWFRPKRARTDHWQPSDDLLIGQLVKRRERYTVTFTLTRMLWGKRSALFARLTALGFRSTIQTAFIERVNLTIRQGVSLLTRRTWSLAQTDRQLLLHIEWWRTYYHFVRPHESLRQPVPGLHWRYQQRTPAMALGLTDRLWSVGDILRTPLIPVA
jgi:IS1 family transposase/transposase-like protein